MPTNTLIRAKGLAEPSATTPTPWSPARPSKVDDRPKVNEVRKEYFKDNKPASTLIESSRFGIKGMLIEIEAIAVTR